MTVKVTVPVGPSGRWRQGPKPEPGQGLAGRARAWPAAPGPGRPRPGLRGQAVAATALAGLNDSMIDRGSGGRGRYVPEPRYRDKPVQQYSVRALRPRP